MPQTPSCCNSSASLKRSPTRESACTHYWFNSVRISLGRCDRCVIPRALSVSFFCSRSFRMVLLVVTAEFFSSRPPGLSSPSSPLLCWSRVWPFYIGLFRSFPTFRSAYFKHLDVNALSTRALVHLPGSGRGSVFQNCAVWWIAGVFFLRRDARFVVVMTRPPRPGICLMNGMLVAQHMSNGRKERANYWQLSCRDILRFITLHQLTSCFERHREKLQTVFVEARMLFVRPKARHCPWKLSQATLNDQREMT